MTPPNIKSGRAVPHVRATAISSQCVVYRGVLRSCFITQLRRSFFNPELAGNTVARPYRLLREARLIVMAA
jgi:hypothetical protein